MSDDIAIRVENLSKLYTLGELERYRTIRETLARAFRRPKSAGNGAGRDTLWALRGVSFEVKRGEVLGIIGPNGAGKSTLLKILSRITEPTEGQADIYGRVGSLLEVGTGFHNELTGRENIYLNGAILGMRRAEIDRKFDEIVAFAGVERFIDTPVKRYSTGMKVRLGFSVAAHLEPEILIVDEVLAVGDVEFQRKCIGKMSDVAGGGRTVLFVSHNMAAVEALCTRATLLREGRIAEQGNVTEVARSYLRALDARREAEVDLRGGVRRRRSSIPVMRRVVLSSEGSTASSVRMGGDLTVAVEFGCDDGARLAPVLGLVVKSALGASVFGVNNRVIPGFRFDAPVSEGIISCRLDDLPLMPGRYVVDLYLGDGGRNVDVVEDAVAFDVIATDFFGTGQLPPASAGPVAVSAVWSLDTEESVRARKAATR